MQPKPFAPEVVGEPAALPDLTTPTTLEALLAMRPSASRLEVVTDAHRYQAPVAQASEPEASAHAQPSQDEFPPLELNASLLFIHSGTAEGTQACGWVQRMSSNSQVRMIQFSDNPLEQIQRHQPQAVLIHFDPTSIEVATQLVAQLQVASPHMPRLAIGHIKHPQCMLAALRSGVQDFLDVDGAMQAAQKTVRELIERIPATQTDCISAPMTAILSARAGMGSSLLSTHLAWYLQQVLSTNSATTDEALDALLIDLGSPNGDCSLYLNTSAEFTFLDAVNNLRRFDKRLASSGLARHASGLRALTLPRQSGLLREISYADVDALLLRLRQYFKHVIADLGSVSTTHLAMRVALRASQIWVVCDQSIASVVSTSELLQKLEEMQIERQRLQLIVSRHDKDLALSATQISEQLQLPLLATIPDRRTALAQAVNQGQLLPPVQRREPYVQALNKLSQQLTSQHHPELHVAPTPTAQGLARFFPRFARG